MKIKVMKTRMAMTPDGAVFTLADCHDRPYFLSIDGQEAYTCRTPECIKYIKIFSDGNIQVNEVPLRMQSYAK